MRLKTRSLAAAAAVVVAVVTTIAVAHLGLESAVVAWRVEWSAVSAEGAYRYELSPSTTAVTAAAASATSTSTSTAATATTTNTTTAHDHPPRRRPARAAPENDASALR